MKGNYITALQEAVTSMIGEAEARKMSTTTSYEMLK